jgi:glycine cleavage system H protein
LLLIPFWLALNKPVSFHEQIRKAFTFLSSGVLNIPQGIFYSKNHTWAYLEKSGIAKVGLDQLILHITGKVSIHYLKHTGDRITKGDLLAEIDQSGKSLKIFSPISGEVYSSNPLLNVNHELMNNDPYGKDWICAIKPSNWVAEIPSCYLAGEATDWLKKELTRYKDFLTLNISKYSREASMTTMQDGGELSENSLSGLPNELWQEFQKEFLNP